MESKALLGSSGDYTNGLSSYTASIIFLNERGELETDKRLIDYFYHLTREIGDITAVKSEKTEVEFSCDDAEVTERFSTVLRQATLDVAKIIKERPSAPPERKSGEWIHDGVKRICPFCKDFIVTGRSTVKYCWNCGERLEERSEE